jgi:hypothetical protein
MYLCDRVSVPSQDGEMSCICVLGVSVYKYMTSHSPDLVQILLTHKYMTSHFPDLVQIPHNTQIHDISRHVFVRYAYLYQVRRVRCHVFVC